MFSQWIVVAILLLLAGLLLAVPRIVGWRYLKSLPPPFPLL
jgi:hypothetical protein